MYACTYGCAEIRNGLLELPPIYVTFIYVCVYVCMCARTYVGTPEGGLCMYVQTYP